VVSRELLNQNPEAFTVVEIRVLFSHTASVMEIRELEEQKRYISCRWFATAATYANPNGARNRFRKFL